MTSRLKEFENTIGYSFKDINLLNVALTHTSYAHECGCKHNERLEFLGDSVLGLCVSDFIYNNYPKLPEGELTKVRAAVVCEDCLARLAKQLNIGKYIRLGKGEAAGGGAKRASILSDAFEAVVAALYIDSGMENTKGWIIDRLKGEISQAVQGKKRIDFKTSLQELTQKGDTGKVTYKVISETGPDHAKEFITAVYVDSKQLAAGRGTSKKEAEQAAAAEAIKLLNKKP